MPVIKPMGKALPRKSPYDRPQTKASSAPSRNEHSAYRPYKPPSNAEEIKDQLRKGLHNIKPESLPGDICPFLGSIPDESNKEALHIDLSNTLVLARDTHYLKVDARDVDMDNGKRIRRAAYLIYVTEHRVTHDMFVEYAIPDHLGDGLLKSKLVADCEKCILNLQNSTGKWFREGVNTARTYFDNDQFDLADGNTLGAIWGFIFDRAPLQITRGMLGTSANLLDLENIFYHEKQTEERKDWQRAFRTLFVTGANMVRLAMPGGVGCVGAKEKLRWYQLWRDLVRRPDFCDEFPNFHFTNLPVRQLATSHGMQQSSTVATNIGSNLSIEDPED